MSFEQQGLVIWWVLAVGLALGVLPRRRPSPAALLLLCSLVVYVAWTALSLLWTQSTQLTMEELARSLGYLGLVALAVAVLDRHSWRAAAAGLGFAALLVCVIALGSRLDPAVFGSDQVDRVLHSTRLSYPFGYWNAVAAWGAMCVALGLAWSAHDHSRIRRAVALSLVPVAATMTYVTYSRAGIAGSALAVLAAIALSRHRITTTIHAAVAAGAGALSILAIRSAPQIAHGTGTSGAGAVVGALVFGGVLCAATVSLTHWVGIDRWRIPARARRPVGAATALVVLVLVVGAGPQLASRAWHSFTRTTTASLIADPASRLSGLSSSRYAVWKSAIGDFGAHAASGTGAGTFEFWWNQHGTTAEFVRDAHNIWLENMAELGLPGLLSIVAVAVAALAVAIAARLRARRAPAAGASAAFLAVLLVYLLHASVDWMWESTAVTVLALTGVAVLAGRLSGPRPRVRLPVRAVLAAGAAAAALVQLPGLISLVDLRNSQAAERAGNLSVALAAARSAVSAEPSSAGTHEQEALVLEAAGRLEQAKREESVAVSHEPANYVHYLIRSRIETELGELNAAVRDYARGRQLRPHASVFALAPYFTTTRSR